MEAKVVFLENLPFCICFCSMVCIVLIGSVWCQAIPPCVQSSNPTSPWGLINLVLGTQLLLPKLYEKQRTACDVGLIHLENKNRWQFKSIEPF